MVVMQKVYLSQDKPSISQVMAIGDIGMTGSFQLEVNDGVLGYAGSGSHKFRGLTSEYQYSNGNSGKSVFQDKKEEPRKLCNSLLKIAAEHESILYCEVTNSSPPGIDININIVLESNKMSMTLNSDNELKGKYKWRVNPRKSK